MEDYIVKGKDGTLKCSVCGLTYSRWDGMKHKAHHERMLQLKEELGQRVADLSLNFESVKDSYYKKANNAQTVEECKEALENILFAFFIRAYIGNSISNNGKGCITLDAYTLKHLEELSKDNPVFNGKNNELAAKASRQMLFENGLVA